MEIKYFFVNSADKKLTSNIGAEKFGKNIFENLSLKVSDAI
tara:strand:+ start:198 stop:320 length:123 start_codon:yes stop_codon:yes gene_type:complete